MTQIHSNADIAADAIAKKRNGISDAVQRGTRSGLLAVESEAVKNLSGSNTDAPFSYPVPDRTGNLRNNRTVQQPEPGIGVLAFLADYAWAVHTGKVSEFKGRGIRHDVQRKPRPFAQDAIDKVNPQHYVIDAVVQAVAS